jgi:hypothetical protein
VDLCSAGSVILIESRNRPGGEMKGKICGGLATLLVSMLGCSKTEVRFEMVERDVSTSAPTEASIDTQVEAPESLDEEAQTCRESGGAACERLLARRGEWAGAAVTLSRLQIAETLALGCTKSPLKIVCDEGFGLIKEVVSADGDLSQLVTRLETDCTVGVRAACLFAGDIYAFRGPGRAEAGLQESDLRKGAKLFEQACSADSQLACLRASELYLETSKMNVLFGDLEAARADLDRVRKLAAMPCDRGDEAGCSVLIDAHLADFMPEPDRDPATARHLSKERCGEASSSSCVTHAKLLLLGLGGEQQVAAGVETLVPTCERSASSPTEEACRILGYLYAGQPDLLAKNPELARRFAKRACEVRAQLSDEPCVVVSEVEELLKGSPTSP